MPRREYRGGALSIMRKRSGMNKFKRFILCAVVFAAIALASFGFAACSGGSKNGVYEGDYHYEADGVVYGVKVRVVVDGGVIASVEVTDHPYTEAASEEDGWTDGSFYELGRQTLLENYAGMTVKEVLALNVACDKDGAPLISSAQGFTSYGENLIITKATQSSGRLLLAVQNALKNA